MPWFRMPSARMCGRPLTISGTAPNSSRNSVRTAGLVVVGAEYSLDTGVVTFF